MPLNEAKYINKSDRVVKAIPDSDFSPYYDHKGDKIPNSKISQSELVYTEDGQEIPNPVSSGGLVPFLPVATSPIGVAGQMLEEGYAYAISQKSPALAILTGLMTTGAYKGQRIAKSHLTEMDVKKIEKVNRGKSIDEWMDSVIKKEEFVDTANKNHRWLDNMSSHRMTYDYPTGYGRGQELAIKGWARPKPVGMPNWYPAEVNITPVPWSRRLSTSKVDLLDEISNTLSHEKWHAFQFQKGTKNKILRGMSRNTDGKWDSDFGYLPGGKTFIDFGKLRNYGLPESVNHTKSTWKQLLKHPVAALRATNIPEFKPNLNTKEYAMGGRVAKPLAVPTPKRLDVIREKWVDYVLEPHEVEARLAEMWVSKQPFKTSGYKHLKKVGYTDGEISTLRGEFQKAIDKSKVDIADWYGSIDNRITPKNKRYKYGI